MKKKLTILILALVLLCSFNATALSIGPEVGFIGSTGHYGASLGLSLKLDKPNLVFTLYPGVGRGWASIYFATDYWFLNNKISDINSNSSFNWFIGLGGMAGVDIYHGSTHVYNSYGYTTERYTYTNGIIGVRIPVGFNFFVNKKIEPYIQLAPTFGIYIYDKDWFYENRVGFAWHIPLSIGCRFKL